MARLALALILSFLIFNRVSAAGLDHCRGCDVEPSLKVEAQQSVNCRNLMAFDDEVGVQSFLTRFEKLLFKKKSKSDFDKLSGEQKVELFHATFNEAVQSFSLDASKSSSPAGLVAQARVLSRAGWKGVSDWGQLQKQLEENPAFANVFKGVDLKAAKTDEEQKKIIGDSQVMAIRYFAEGFTVSEMLNAEVLPSAQTKGRLYLALAEKYKVPSDQVVAFVSSSSSCQAQLASKRMPASETGAFFCGLDRAEFELKLCPVEAPKQ